MARTKAMVASALVTAPTTLSGTAKPPPRENSWADRLTSRGAMPKADRPITATTMLMQMPRRRFGMITMMAEVAAMLAQAPQVSSKASSAANEATPGISANRAAGTDSAAASTAPSSTPPCPRRWPRSAAVPPSTAPTMPEPRFNRPIQVPKSAGVWWKVRVSTGTAQMAAAASAMPTVTMPAVSGSRKGRQAHNTSSASLKFSPVCCRCAASWRGGSRMKASAAAAASTAAANSSCTSRHGAIAGKTPSAAGGSQASSLPARIYAAVPPKAWPSEVSVIMRPRSPGLVKSATSDNAAGCAATTVAPTIMRARKAVVKSCAKAVSTLPAAHSSASISSRRARLPRSTRRPSGIAISAVGKAIAIPCSRATWLSPRPRSAATSSCMGLRA